MPHPDDAARITRVFEAVERGKGVLAVEESADFLRPYFAAITTK